MQICAMVIVGHLWAGKSAHFEAIYFLQNSHFPQFFAAFD